MKKQILQNKHGDISSKYLIYVVITVLGFVLLLFIYSQFFFTQEIGKEVCHESIIARSTFNFGPAELGKTIPLQCKTEKICLSSGKEKCPLFGEESDDNPITSVSIDKDADKAKSEVLAEIANALYDCNSMLGEGKLDFMPHKGFQEDYCLICSRFSLDPESAERVKFISYGELYRYLELKKTPEGKTYLSYLYPGWEGWEKSKELFGNLQKESSSDSFNSMKYEDWGMNLTLMNNYAIIAKMSPAGTWTKWAGIAGVVGGGVLAVVGILAIPVSGPIGAGIAAVGVKLTVGTTIVAGSAIYVYGHPNGDYQWIPPAIFPHDTASLTSLKCSSFETAP